MAKRQALKKALIDFSDGEEWFYAFFDQGGGESEEEMVQNAIDFCGASNFEDAVFQTVSNPDMGDEFGYNHGSRSEVNAIVDSILAYVKSKGIYKSVKKSNGGKMAKSQAVKKTNESWGIDKLETALRAGVVAYDEWYDSEAPSNDEESRLYNEIESDIDDLVDKIYEYCRVLSALIDGGYSASTKKSKYARLHKALNKLGGFTKEDDGEEESDESEEEETEEESEEGDGEEKPKVVDEGESDESEKGCKSEKSLRTSKKRMKMRKAEEMPEDADDQQDINQKGSGNAGSELPEDADEVTEINQKGSGNAGSDLPEDADDAEDQKQARARKQRMMRSSNKGMRKFSVTPGGQPNQESYAQRYSQAPMVREAINRHFGDSTNKSFDDVQMLQDRIDAMNKSRRNTESNNVPMKLRRR